MWRSCERLGLRPPGIKIRWEDNGREEVAALIAYGQIRELEEAELAAKMIRQSI